MSVTTALVQHKVEELCGKTKCNKKKVGITKQGVKFMGVYDSSRTSVKNSSGNI